MTSRAPARRHRGLLGRRDRVATCLAIEASDTDPSDRFRISTSFLVDEPP
jgi:hypothetical protein